MPSRRRSDALAIFGLHSLDLVRLIPYRESRRPPNAYLCLSSMILARVTSNGLAFCPEFAFSYSMLYPPFPIITGFTLSARVAIHNSSFSKLESDTRNAEGTHRRSCLETNVSDCFMLIGNEISPVSPRRSIGHFVPERTASGVPLQVHACQATPKIPNYMTSYEPSFSKDHCRQLGKLLSHYVTECRRLIRSQSATDTH